MVKEKEEDIKRLSGWVKEERRRRRKGKGRREGGHRGRKAVTCGD